MSRKIVWQKRNSHDSGWRIICRRSMSDVFIYEVMTARDGLDNESWRAASEAEVECINDQLITEYLQSLADKVDV